MEMSTPRASVNVCELLAPYYGSGLYLAVSRDRSTVHLTDLDMASLARRSRQRGLRDYVILKSPDNPPSGRIY